MNFKLHNVSMKLQGNNKKNGFEPKIERFFTKKIDLHIYKCYRR